MRMTLREIGKAIKRGSEYLPIRNLAASLATKAPPKDFLAQLKIVYDYVINNWRYVRDPAHKELLTASPRAIYNLVLAGDGKGMGYGKGAGDCDCITVGLGSLLESIGFKLRIATTANVKSEPSRLFEHVFLQAFVKPIGWITVDPVLHPHRKFGAITTHSRIALWDLNGNLLGYSGNVQGNLGSFGGNDMYEPLDTYKDYSGLFGFAGAESGEPEPWETVGLADWGYLSPQMGIINGDELPELKVEVTPDMSGLARTPMIELAPEDYKYVQVFKEPYDGMLGLGDDSEAYVYDGLGGFFKRLFKKVRKKVRKVARKIGRGLKKVIRKLPGGKWLLKIAGKIRKVAMKIVRPLAKFVGKFASKLAPIAALIPGYGPAIAAGLHAAGKIAKLMHKYSVKLVGKKGKVRDLFSKKPRNIKKMQKELAAEARKAKKRKAIARAERAKRRSMARAAAVRRSALARARRRSI